MYFGFFMFIRFLMYRLPYAFPPHMHLQTRKSFGQLGFQSNAQSELLVPGEGRPRGGGPARRGGPGVVPRGA